MLYVFPDTDPTPGGGHAPGTATFRATIEVDAAGATLTYADATIDVRDAHGTPLFSGPFDVAPSTRVTSDHNPMTGCTVTDATPAAATPDAATPAP